MSHGRFHVCYANTEKSIGAYYEPSFTLRGVPGLKVKTHIANIRIMFEESPGAQMVATYQDKFGHYYPVGKTTPVVCDDKCR